MDRGKMIYISMYILILNFFNIFTCDKNNASFNQKIEQQILNNRKLKILMIIDKFPYEPRQYINNQIAQLIELGHDIYILAFRTTEYDNYPMLGRYNVLDKVFYKELPADLKEFDIIYCQFGQLGNYYIENKEKLGLKGKLVVSFRGSDGSRKLLENPHLYDDLFNQIDKALPVCTHFKDLLVTHGCDLKKIFVNYSGIKTELFKFVKRVFSKKNTIKFLSVGRLIPMKAFHIPIKTIARLKKYYPNIVYYIIGSGQEYKKLSHLIKRLDVENEVKLLGQLSHKEVRQMMQKADILLHLPITMPHGEREGIPNVIMEAMASGMIVIGTDHSGIPELVEDGKNGFIVSEKKIKPILEKILWLIAHPKVWKSISLNARKKAKSRHDIKIVTKKLEQVFFDLIA